MKRQYFILAALFLFAGMSLCNAAQRSFEITARKFSFEPGIIHVNRGDTVRIRLVSEDVTHGIFIDGYGIQANASPGSDGSLTFVADKGGRYTFRCTVTCGEFHPYMTGFLVVQRNSLTWIFGVLLVLGALINLLAVAAKRKRKGSSGDKLLGLFDLSGRFEITRFPLVRNLFKSRWNPLILLIINMAIFFVILLAGFLGGFQAGNYNFGIMIVWILWWVMLMFLLVPGFSRAWCMMCPFPLFSDWYQRSRLFDVTRGTLRGLRKRWPKRLKNMWVMNIGFLFTTFFSGFFTVRPFATFILLGLIILIAFIIGMIYEKRTFCLYICPVSGFQGLYSQFSTAEIRCIDPEVCKGHTPKTCFVGDEKGYGCPWNLTPFNFEKNTYCGMCLECFKSCPYDNMGFYLRPPGTDLLVDTKREPKGYDEAWKAFIMLGIAIVFYLAFQGPWGFIKDMIRGTTLPGYLTFVASHTVMSLIALPAVYLIFAALSRAVSGSTTTPLRKIFINFSYTLIPLGLGVWIAFSVGIILPNGSYILHVISDPFAWGWNLFGTANFPWTPVLTQYIGWLQGGVLFVFYVLSLAYGHRISDQTFENDPEAAQRGWIPILVFLSLLTLAFLWLFVGG